MAAFRTRLSPTPQSRTLVARAVQWMRAMRPHELHKLHDDQVRLPPAADVPTSLCLHEAAIARSFQHVSVASPLSTAHEPQQLSLVHRG